MQPKKATKSTQPCRDTDFAVCKLTSAKVFNNFLFVERPSCVTGAVPMATCTHTLSSLYIITLVGDISASITLSTISGVLPFFTGLIRLFFSFLCATSDEVKCTGSKYHHVEYCSRCCVNLLNRSNRNGKICWDPPAPGSVFRYRKRETTFCIRTHFRIY